MHRLSPKAAKNADHYGDHYRTSKPLSSRPRVDKQECATLDLFCTICRYPPPPLPAAEFLLPSPFFRRTRILPQSSVRARAGHRLCNVKPGKVHEAKLSKRLAARASSKRFRQQKNPPRANPPRSCTLLFIYSCPDPSINCPIITKLPHKCILAV